MSTDEELSVDDVAELIQFLEELAEEYPYLDEYKILIVEESTEPIIVMNPAEFLKLQKRVLGE